MSQQKSKKTLKTFTSPFNNPVKHSGIKTKRNIPCQKSAQSQIMETSAAIESLKPNLKKKIMKNDSSSEEQYSYKKEKKAESKKLSTSLTDAEYDEIFSSVIKRALTRDISSSNEVCGSENSDSEVEIEDRADIPKPNEAVSPQEAAEGPIEVSLKQPLLKRGNTIHSNNQKAYEENNKNLGCTPKSPDKSSFQKFTLKESRLTGTKVSTPSSQCNSVHSFSGTNSKHNSQHSHGSSHVCRKKSSQAKDKDHMQKCQNWHDAVTLKLSSQSQCSQIALSQPGPELSLKERLLWLQKRRDVGLWVQCSRPICNKWRYLHNTCDPIEVPHEWFCHMNPDKNYNSCASPEKPPTPLEEEDLIHNVYTAGSIVWGHLAGFPWWPAIIDDDPDVEQYYWLNSFSDIPTHYNVVFFDEKDVTRAWLTPGQIRPFTGQENYKEFKKTVARGIDYAKRLQLAKIQAQKALPLSIGERLKTFGFLARFKGAVGSSKKKQPHDKKRKHDEDETFSQSAFEDEVRLKSVISNKELKVKKKKVDNTPKCILKESILQEGDSQKSTHKTTDETSDVAMVRNDGTSMKSKTRKKSAFSSPLFMKDINNEQRKSLSQLKEKSGTEICKEDSLQHPSNKSIKGNPKTNEVEEILKDDGSETQFEEHEAKEMHSKASDENETESEENEDVINSSQDLFSSQKYAPEKTTVKEIVTESNTTNEDIHTNNSLVRILEGETDNRIELDDIVNVEQRIQNEAESSENPILQSNITDNAPVESNCASRPMQDEQLNCSDSLALVPVSGHDTDQPEVVQSVCQNYDAVVPQVNVENFDYSSDFSCDFEREE